jgi:aryl-alcohol dehydrogenase-like predicted oxidoreductase
MEYRKLGRSGMFVSVIGMGGWALSTDKNFGEQDETASIATVHAALDAGVNFFDSAEGYGKEGRSEVVLGKALAGRRHQAVIGTKIEVDLAYVSAQETIEACEHSLRRLNTDHIDLYQIHWPSRLTPLQETMEAMEKLLQQGKIRAVGVSNFGVQDLADLQALGRAESNQVPYSLLFRAIEFGVAPSSVEAGMSIMPYSPLSQGLLTGKFASADDVPIARARTRHYSTNRPLARHGEDGFEKETFEAIARIGSVCDEIGQPMTRVALAWLLHQPGVTSVIVGARNTEQLEQNVQAAALTLSSDVLAELAAATDDLMQKMGSNTDPWQSDARPR